MAPLPLEISLEVLEMAALSQIEMRKTPIHWLRVATSFALLGAVVAGMFTTVPLPFVASAEAVIDFRAVGAILGLVVGVGQIARQIFWR